MEELPDGSLRVTLPISITTSVLAAELGSPISADLTVVLTGEIVAVPEPGRDALGLGALGALAGLAGRRQRQPRKRRRRIGFATAALLALMTGSLVSCWGPPQIGYGRMSLIGGFSCFADRTNVSKPGSEIFDDTYDTCLSRNYFGTFGHSPEVAFTMNPFSAFLYQAGHHALVTLAVTTGFDLTSAIPMTINRSMSFDHRYSAVQGGSSLQAGDSPPQLFARAQMYRLGVAQEEEFIPSVSVTIGGAAQVRLANAASLDLPVDGAYHFFDLDAGGGSIQFDLEFDGQRIAPGSGTQMLGVSFGVRADTCMAHQECVDINPEAPFCSPVGCTDGATGTACSHDSQCQEAQGLFCSSLGTCSNGTVGAACIEGEGDCDPGLACSAMLCATP
ncbi:MAG: hypothetical protein JRJ58_13150 [Deltaproteobacteria bacterium]|nr:hypothetical protein [Deltaproteobacteria bacterium]